MNRASDGGSAYRATLIDMKKKKKFSLYFPQHFISRKRAAKCWRWNNMFPMTADEELSHKAAIKRNYHRFIKSIVKVCDKNFTSHYTLDVALTRNATNTTLEQFKHRSVGVVCLLCQEKNYFFSIGKFKRILPLNWNWLFQRNYKEDKNFPGQQPHWYLKL